MLRTRKMLSKNEIESNKRDLCGEIALAWKGRA